MKSRIGLAVSGVTVGILFMVSGCGTATQQTPATTSNTSANATNANASATTTTSKFPNQKSGYAGGMQFASLSKVLKLPTTTLMQDLKGGESLAQIAQKQNVSQKTLISTMESSYQAELRAGVSSGKISATQEKQMIAHYDANISTIIQRKGMPNYGKGHHFTNHVSHATSTNTTN